MSVPQNRFKPMSKEGLAPNLPIKPAERRNDQAARSTAIKPRPEDIETLVKSDVEMAFYVECTPDIQRACLALNTDNYRPLGADWSDQLRSDMEAKPTRFKRAGDPIRFDVDGIMIDGQHRFDAGVRANFTFTYLFVIGLPKEAREVIDFGRTRKVAHVVRNMGYDNAYMLSSAASWLCKFKKGLLIPSGLVRDRNGAGTTEEILDMIRKHPKLHTSTNKCKQAGRQPIPGSLLAAVHYIGSDLLKKPKMADEFVWEIKNYPKKSKQNGAPFALNYELEQRVQRGLDVPRNFKARGVVEAWNLFSVGAIVENNISLPERLSFNDLDYDVL